MQVLIRSPHLPHVQVNGREQVEIDLLDRAEPATISSGPYPLVVLQQAVTAGIAVVVKRDDAIGHVDMISPRKTFGRDNSLRIKAGKRGLIEKNASEDVAGAVAKKDAVGQRPPPMRVRLNARFENIHSRSPILIRAEAAYDQSGEWDAFSVT